MLASEADEYYRRNKDKYAQPGSKAHNDRVLAAVNALRLKPSAILEIGCGHGWRLERLRTTLDASCVGIDPSPQAIADGEAAFELCRALFMESSLYFGVSTALRPRWRAGVIDPDGLVAVSVLFKNTQHAYPCNPFTTA